MGHNTRVEFGWVVQPAPRGADGGESLRADNQRFLELIRDDFQSVWLEDHFQWVSPESSRNTLEGWTHLCYLLPHFQNLRFGTLVLGQSYRNPALLAKMAATLHYLSGGRLILGIGAGWKADEYHAYGWPFPAPGVRTRQLDEYAQVLRLMLTQSPVSFEGRYYSIKDAYNDPLPSPPIPLMIGGNGERGTLRTTARHADWWNFPLRTPELFAHKAGVLRQHCDAVGRNFDEIVLTAFQFVSLSDDPSRIRRAQQIHTVAGNSDEVTRELEEFVRLGTRHFMFRFVDFPSTEGIELFLEKVLPRFR